MMNWLNKIFKKNPQPQRKKVVVDLRFEQQSFRLEDFTALSKTSTSAQDTECLDDCAQSSLTAVQCNENEHQPK